MEEVLGHRTGLVKAGTSYENGVSQRPSLGQKQGPPSFFLSERNEILTLFFYQSRADFPRLSPQKFNLEIMGADHQREGVPAERGHPCPREISRETVRQLALKTPGARPLVPCGNAPAGLSAAWVDLERDTLPTPAGCNHIPPHPVPPSALVHAAYTGPKSPELASPILCARTILPPLLSSSKPAG